MPPAGLGGLPVELLVRICNVLRLNHPPSLLSLALTNKSFYAAAAALLFQTIKFTVAGHKQLVKAVENCVAKLGHDGHLRHVRQLIVAGNIVPVGHEDVGWSSGSSWSARASSDEEGHNSLALVSPFPNCLNLIIQPTDTEDTAADVLLVDQNWQPLADLIQQLPRLADLVYTCPSQFPPCLLDAIHQHHPRCRLSINAFRLRSTVGQPMDSYEQRLATSPCLYRIHTELEDFSGGPDLSAYPHADLVAIRLAAGMAPNLGEVSLGLAHWTSPQPDPRPSPRDIFRTGAGMPALLPLSPGSLRSLVLFGERAPPPHYIQIWREHINFSALQLLHFSIAEPLQDGTLEALADVAEGGNFVSLSSLVLHIPNPGQVAVAATLKRLLSNIPCLLALQLEGWVSGGDILLSNGLGRNLCKLYLHGSTSKSAMSVEQVDLLREHCSGLEELAAVVRRSKGDQAEVDVYRALSRLPRLRRLHLLLVQPVPTRREVEAEDDDASLADTDDFYRQRLPANRTWLKYRYSQVRDALINSAVDETLAREIFAEISPPDRQVPLESLSIRVGQDPAYFSSVFEPEIFGTLRRNWNLTRNVRDDRRDEICAVEADKDTREMMDQQCAGSLSRKSGRPLVEICRRIWPPPNREGRPVEWPWEWYSFPLS